MRDSSDDRVNSPVAEVQDLIDSRRAALGLFIPLTSNSFYTPKPLILTSEVSSPARKKVVSQHRSSPRRAR